MPVSVCVWRWLTAAKWLYPSQMCVRDLHFWREHSTEHASGHETAYRKRATTRLYLYPIHDEILPNLAEAAHSEEARFVLCPAEFCHETCVGVLVYCWRTNYIFGGGSVYVCVCERRQSASGAACYHSLEKRVHWEYQVVQRTPKRWRRRRRRQEMLRASSQWRKREREICGGYERSQTITNCLGFFYFFLF